MASCHLYSRLDLVWHVLEVLLGNVAKLKNQSSDFTPCPYISMIDLSVRSSSLKNAKIDHFQWKKWLLTEWRKWKRKWKRLEAAFFREVEAEAEAEVEAVMKKLV